MNILHKGKLYSSFTELFKAVTEVTVTIPGDGVYTFECKEDADQFVTELGYSLTVQGEMK